MQRKCAERCYMHLLVWSMYVEHNKSFIIINAAAIHLATFNKPNKCLIHVYSMCFHVIPRRVGWMWPMELSWQHPHKCNTMRVRAHALTCSYWETPHSETAMAGSVGFCTLDWFCSAFGLLRALMVLKAQFLPSYAPTYTQMPQHCTHFFHTTLLILGVLRVILSYTVLSCACVSCTKSRCISSQRFTIML